jgi:hypothetical protein
MMKFTIDVRNREYKDKKNNKNREPKDKNSLKKDKHKYGRKNQQNQSKNHINNLRINSLKENHQKIRVW